MIPIICITGETNSGKTLFIERIIPELKRRGFRVGTIKHASCHQIEIERKGKDSWRHARAGSDITVISSLDKLVMIRNVENEFTLKKIAEYLFDSSGRHCSEIDIILAEGYKDDDYPKIEINMKGIKFSSISHDYIRKDDITKIVDLIEKEFLAF
ncbi:MAG: molybdopterin-guanine dinucleotide biosynthesis protein B [Nitrospirota bacterium]